MFFEIIDKLRSLAPAQSLGWLVSWLGTVPGARRRLLGLGSQHGLRDIHKRRPFKRIDLPDEIIWTALILQQRSSALNRFNEISGNISNSVLNGNNTQALEHLDEMDRSLGFSLWSIETRLALLQIAHGQTEQRRHSEEIIEIAGRSFAAFVAHHVSRRNQDDVRLHRFCSRFRRQMQSWDLTEDLRDYISYRVMGEAPSAHDSLGHLLRHDQTSSTIDLYETFLFVIRRSISLFRSQSGPSTMSSALAYSLDIIRDIKDSRTAKMRMLLHIAHPADAKHPPTDRATSESYWAGTYDQTDALARAAILRSTADTSALIYAARSRALLGQVQNIETPPSDALLSQLAMVFGRTDSSERAHAELTRFCLNFRCLPSAPAIQAAVEIEVRRTIGSEQELRETKLLTSGVLDPLDAHGLAADTRAAVLHAATEAGATDDQVEFARLLSGEVSPSDASHLAARLAPERRAALFAESHLARGEHDEALVYARELLQSTNPALRAEGGRLEVESRLHQGDIEAAMDRIASLCVTNDSMRFALPLHRLYFNRRFKTFKPFLANLSTLITFDLRYRQTEHMDDRTHLRWACDEFFVKRGYVRPSDIAADVSLFPKDQLVYFLRRICVPSILEACRSLPTSRSTEEERLNLCSLLVDLDPLNAEVYHEEITTLAAKLLVEEGVRLVDKSRIYVDTAGLTRWAERELRSTYELYLTRRTVSKQSSEKEFEALVRDHILAKKPLPEHYLRLPSEESDALLIELVETLRREFLLNPEHGLNSFLSMRIRHGSLVNALRGPLEEHLLAATHDATTDKYFPNEQRVAQLGDLDERSKHDTIDMLCSLSEEYDGLINEKIKPCIQIQTAEHKDALIGRPLPPVLLHAIRHDTSYLSDFNAFLELCFQLFRTRLTEELREAQEVIRGIYSVNADNIFQMTFEQIDRLPQVVSVAQLRDSVLKAKSDAYGALTKVLGWLKIEDIRSVDNSYTLSQVLDVAVESANRTLRGFHPVVCKTVDGETRMGSSVLGEISDIVFIAWDNAFKHSQLVSPKMDIHLQHDSDNMLRLRIESEVPPHVRTSASDHVLSEIRQSILDSAYIDHVPQERRSGLRKLKWILSSHAHHEYEFGFTAAGRFFIQLGLSLVFLEAAERSEILPAVSRTT